MPAGTIDRSHLIVIAAGFAGGLAAFAWLPRPYFGPEQSLIVRAAIAFLIPTAVLVTCGAVETLFSRTSSDVPAAESAKAVHAVVSFTAWFMVALHALVLLSLLGFPISGFPVHRLVVVLFGLLLVGIGNVLPRIRPNPIIGLHTRRLLTNRTAWARVHRLAGYFLVVLGVAAIGAGLALSKTQIPLVLSAGVVVGATVNLAGYWRWTRG